MNKLTLIFIALTLAACGPVNQDSTHTVQGESLHRVLIGIDIEGMRAVFEDGCHVQCDEELPTTAPDELYEQCVDACVAEKVDAFVVMMSQFYEELEQQGSEEQSP